MSKHVYSHHFAWHVEQDGNHRWVIIAVNDEAHLLQSGPEVSGVFCQLLDPSNTSVKAKTPPDVHVRGPLSRSHPLSGGTSWWSSQSYLGLCSSIWAVPACALNWLACSLAASADGLLCFDTRAYMLPKPGFANCKQGLYIFFFFFTSNERLLMANGA